MPGTSADTLSQDVLRCASYTTLPALHQNAKPGRICSFHSRVCPFANDVRFAYESLKRLQVSKLSDFELRKDTRPLAGDEAGQ